MAEDDGNKAGLEQLRSEIDRIDRQIIDLLNQRYRVVHEIGEAKRRDQLPFYVPEREKGVLDRLHELNPGPMPAATLDAIYREIMSGALFLEQPLRVACLGPEGTFAQQAALAKFGHGVELITVKTMADVFQEVESERADYGCVPVENSTEGVVNPTLDALTGSSVRVVAELELRVHHQLLSHSPLSEIRCIYSHPQSFGQCREFLRSNLPSAQLIEVSSNARAAELAARETGVAALAGEAAAIKYELPIQRRNVEDNPRNTTRFLIIGRQDTLPTGDDKTSLCFSLRDRSGALSEALEPFTREGITMSMIESRPLKYGNWEYCFFVDILGHITDEPVARACAELEKISTFFKVFGSYPRFREG